MLLKRPRGKQHDGMNTIITVDGLNGPCPEFCGAPSFLFDYVWLFFFVLFIVPLESFWQFSTQSFIPIGYSTTRWDVDKKHWIYHCKLNIWNEVNNSENYTCVYLQSMNSNQTRSCFESQRVKMLKRNPSESFHQALHCVWNVQQAPRCLCGSTIVREDVRLD